MKNNFNNIISEFESFIKSLNDSSDQKLISFAFELENLEKFYIINQLSEIYDDIFLFQTTDNKFNFIGLNSAINLLPSNANKFYNVSESFNYWANNFIHNWSKIDARNTPIILCSAKFDSESSSILWSEFEALRIYVPEFMISFQNDYVIGYYNFILNPSSQKQNYLKTLSSYIKNLSGLKAELTESLTNKTIISSTNKNNDIANWERVTLKAIKHLHNGEIDKLVLSRSYSFDIETKINWNSLLQELYKRFSNCYLFFIKKNNSIFFGSSPEMFLKVLNYTAEVESVAGSAARGEKKESDFELEKFLKSSDKNHQEHLFVSDYITDILIKYSNNVRVIEEKQIRKLDNIQHLITKISAELNSKQNLFQLIDSLFPTPAVCGVPKEKAIRLIRELEAHDRGLYSGLVGMFDFNGDCELAVSIRSALVKESKVTAFAGAGLVKNSDPHEEFIETKLKLNTILSLFIDENKS